MSVTMGSTFMLLSTYIENPYIRAAFKNHYASFLSFSAQCRETCTFY